jgi:hypothetical protein
MDTPEPCSPARTFISYARQDSVFALQLASELRAAGAPVWLDQLDMPAGQRWDNVIQKALRDCPRLLVILSPSSVSSENVMDEVSFALDEDKTIIPVLLRDCDIPMRLRRFHRVDVRNGLDSLDELLRVLGVRRSGPLVQPTRIPSAPRYSLRSDSKVLSVNDAKMMVIKRGFYCAYWNELPKSNEDAYEIPDTVDDALVVVDRTTGLMWQRGGSDVDDSHTFTGAKARDYTDGLNAKKFAGEQNWRVPTLEEAMSLMMPPENGIRFQMMDGRTDRLLQEIVHIHPVFQKNVYYIWTSDGESPGFGWVVYYVEGFCKADSLEHYFAQVKAVRSMSR